ncbi:PIN domain-containing protein [Candidatus Micrarchaeota archaeon]|nr:PIN domain-containing protein [Candidatus Micrarchaeota archaeon]
MALYIDSDVLILFLKGDEKIASRIEKAISEHGKLALPSIVCFEVLCGSFNEMKRIHDFSKDVEIAPFDRNAAQIASAIYKHLKSKGEILELGDIAIAAIAISNSQEKPCILTNNIRHFSRIPGLKLA